MGTVAAAVGAVAAAAGAVEAEAEAETVAATACCDQPDVPSDEHHWCAHCRDCPWMPRRARPCAMWNSGQQRLRECRGVACALQLAGELVAAVEEAAALRTLHGVFQWQYDA